MPDEVGTITIYVNKAGKYQAKFTYWNDELFWYSQDYDNIDSLKNALERIKAYTHSAKIVNLVDNLNG